ncbi:MAG: hypothetical protein PSV46_26665 [Reyranella sp.]|nr:hypothetical protein [Reyranella sp.]
MWLHILRRYFGAIVVGNLVWEAAQLPLYAIWKTGTARDLAIAVLHCTAGDFAISASALVAALALGGEKTWPRHRFGAVAGGALAFGIAYTIYSERMNVLVLHNWTYSGLMPVLPGLEVGLSPLLQWLFIPVAAFAWARRSDREP